MAVYAELRVQMERDVKFDGVVPKFWLKESNAKDRIKAVFVLKHDPAAMKKYEKDLLDRATPKSKNYGKWFTKEEIKQIAPAEASIKAVIDFISSFSGVEYKLSTLGDMIFIDAPVELAESMFDTKFATFRSIVSPLVTVQRVTKPYSLPESIAAHVSIVDDLIRLPLLCAGRIK
jgi:subtilase family serine protease